MLAPSRIRCRVIAVPVSGEIASWRGAARPSELVPWADPYIAGLIHRLQEDVRRQRASTRVSPDESAELQLTAFELEPLDTDDEFVADCFNEAEWPWDDDQYDRETPDDEPRAVPNFDDDRGDLPTNR